jgi:hypothetical protein
MKSALCSVVLTVLSAAAISSETTGQIVEVRTGPYYGSIVAISLNPAPSGQPACSNLGTRGHYLVDTSGPAGKQWLAVILSAHGTQRTARVYGTGACISAGSFLGEAIETIAAQ